MVIFCFSGQALAITWQDVLKLAPDESNEIKSARKQLESYQWTYYKSYSNFLPQVSASLSTGNTNGAAGETDAASLGLSATQYLFTGMSNYYTLQSAGVNLDYYRANLLNAEANYYYSARLAFLDLYFAQQNLVMREKIRQYRANNARIIKLLYESGKEDQGNYLRTAAQFADAENSVVVAGRQLELARLKMSQLLNTTVASAEGEPAATAESLPDIDRLTNTSPAYRLAKDQLELADIAQRNTLSEFFPTVALAGSYRKSGTSWPPSDASKALTLSVSLPIFPGGSNIADRAAYGLLLEKAREDFAKSQKDVYYGIKEAYENLNTTLGNYDVQKDYFKAAEERGRISQSKYLNGLSSYNDWDIIQNEYVNNQINLLLTNKAVLAAEASWYKSYGGYIK